MTEQTPKQQYYKAMSEYLRARGEIKFEDSGYKSNIVGKDTIITTQILLLPEFGFCLEQDLEYDEDTPRNAFVITELEHSGGYRRILREMREKWVQYPEGYEKQFNHAMDRQSAKTYIERNHICDLLYIAQGFNPEKEWNNKELKAGNITLITTEQVKEILKLMGEEITNIGPKLNRLYKIKAISEIQTKDYDAVIKLIKENT